MKIKMEKYQALKELPCLKGIVSAKDMQDDFDGIVDDFIRQYSGQIRDYTKSGELAEVNFNDGSRYIFKTLN